MRGEQTAEAEKETAHSLAEITELSSVEYHTIKRPISAAVTRGNESGRFYAAATSFKYAERGEGDTPEEACKNLGALLDAELLAFSSLPPEARVNPLYHKLLAYLG